MSKSIGENYFIRSEYLAKGVSFLGFRYQKQGYGNDTMYVFEDTEPFRNAVDALLELKKIIGVYK